RHVLGKLERDAVRVVGESTVAVPVATLVRPGVLPDRQERRAPQTAAVLVAHVDDLARLVADRIVRPGPELVLAAVERPRVPGARLRDLEAEPLVRDHVDPRRRRPVPLVEHDRVLAAVLDEAAEVVVELAARTRRRRLEVQLARRRRSALAPFTAPRRCR